MFRSSADCFVKSQVVYNIHSDHLSTPRAVTNAKNEKLWQWEGDAFGDVQPQVEHVKMPLRFTGQYSDEEVGLFYNYFRFYDPATGRYIENDPIDLQGGLNRYGYVGGSPLHAVDPYGLNPATIGMGCALGSWAGPVGCGMGAMIGGLIGAVTIIAILSTPSDSIQDDTSFMDNACPPNPNNQDPCKGLRKKLQEHIDKLQQYMNDPLSMDNKGHLSNALKRTDQTLFWRIRAGRIAELNKQIAEFQRKLKLCEERYGSKY